MTREQAEFDEAFEGIVVEDSLDHVIECLAAVGMVVEPWQRDVLAEWCYESDQRVPLPCRVQDLRRRLSS